MSLNQAFAYKSLRANSVKASLFNADVVNAAGAIVLDGTNNDLKLNLAAEKGLEIASNALGIKLASANALELGAGGLDLKATIAGNRTFSNNVVITGDLTVNGTTTTVNSTVVEIADKLIQLNRAAIDAAGVALPTAYSGFVIERGNEAAAADKRNFAGLVWDEANDKFVAAFVEPNGTVLGAKVDLEVNDLAVVDINASGTITGTVAYAPAVAADWTDPDPTTVAGALDALAAGLKNAGSGLDNHLNDATDAHDASAISFDPAGRSIALGDDVQEVIGQLDTALQNHLDDATDAHDASAISFSAAGLTQTDADDVQEAIADLDAALKAHLDDAVGAHAATAISFSAAGLTQTDADDVQEAIADLDAALKAHLDDAVGAHAASAISFVATGLTQTDADDVQEAIADLDAALKAHLDDAVGAHAATAISFSDAGLAVVDADDVQGAIADLDAAVDAVNDWKVGRSSYVIQAGDISGAVAGLVSLTVPSFKVGVGNLIVFVDTDFQLPDSGSVATPNNDGFYFEIGSNNAASTEIKVRAADLVAGMKLGYISLPFTGNV